MDTTTEVHPRNCFVAILTHECRQQYANMSVGMLTQFFLDNNNVATGVNTFVIDNGIGHVEVSLAKTDNYSKKLCNVPYLVNLAYMPTSVMFILCHGSAASDTCSTPYLGFSEDAARNMLWPCSGHSPTV